MEIKFKCFNKKNKKIFKVTEINFGYYVVCKTKKFVTDCLRCSKEKCFVPCYDLKDCILLPYTGKKDYTKWEELSKKEKKEWIDEGNTKDNWKGKEIYLEDIVDDGKEKGAEWYGKGHVVFFNGIYWTCLKNGYVELTNNPFCRIIGNRLTERK
jgi:hypothetical protein